MMTPGPPNATLTTSVRPGRIVTVRVGERAWVAAVALAVCEWRDVPGEFTTEAEAIVAAARVLREATDRRS